MMRKANSGLLLFLLVSVVACAHAQTEDVNFKVRCVADPAKVAEALKLAADKKQEPDITGGKVCHVDQTAPPAEKQVANPSSDAARVTSEREYTFDSKLTLVVEHVPEMSFDEVGEPNPGDLVMFLDGKPLHGTHPQLGASATDENDITTTLLTYRITHDVTTSAARASWKEVLAGDKSQRIVTVSTGLETGAPAQSGTTILFTAIPTGRAFGFAAVAAALIIVFLVIAGKTGALRDKEPGGPHIKREKDRAYSLSRCQIALWTAIVVLSYLFIWILTGEYSTTIPASVVTLMGISLSAYGVAAAVDAGAATSNQEKLKKLQKEKKANASGDGAQAKEAQQKAAEPVNEEVAEEGEDNAHADEQAILEKRAKVCRSEGVVKDLVTSGEGTSLHRLQFAVWTLALMAVFLATVWTTLAMPDFDTTLLALMGISSGTYVGLKIPENKC